MQIIATADGSSTLFDESLDETYHSVHGALSESRHVYIAHGFQKMPADKSQINVLEIGFGTGLNALLTIDSLLAHQQVNYYSIEAYPLSEELLNTYYEGFIEKPQSLAFLPKMIACQSLEVVDEQFSFQLIQTKLENWNPEEQAYPLFDLVYYDAFAPSKQPEMWTIENLKKVSHLMADSALFVTYCSQGQFKRNLKTLGFEIECPAGPFGKREICVAQKIKTML